MVSATRPASAGLRLLHKIEQLVLGKLCLAINECVCVYLGMAGSGRTGHSPTVMWGGNTPSGNNATSEDLSTGGRDEASKVAIATVVFLYT